MEGLGKFKLSSSQPGKGGASHKAKFLMLKESYDTVIARHQELLRELQVANSKLKSVQAENDLLLDALGIVANTQPTLVGILQQMDPEPLFPPGEAYPPHRGPYAALPPAAYVVDAPPPSLNGNGHSDHSTHRAANGRSRSSREYRDQLPPINDESADQEMIVIDAERELGREQHEHENEREYSANAAVPPPGPGSDGH
ncbi:hypothetical protein A7U60_g6632 [Sanghuangporus baumii]|uniref:Uncharacterized protein n=1 Tax=Sanghuangporus baumii TaxID=108892 RepID=A0A9Q5HUR5_SANBA|nr:hypothetical protein A7U60_g6630 [Sanghuangporus baumii]OCB86319.1 hypothetical protein A7U60_g6632 [Sanghuangporus baumii]